MSRTIVLARSGSLVLVACASLFGCGGDASSTGIDAGAERDAATARDASGHEVPDGDAAPRGDSGAGGDGGGADDAGASSDADAGEPTRLAGWELTADNTGLAGVGLSCAELPLYTGELKPPRGARISEVRITGPLDLSNGEIVVERSCIRPTTVGYHNSFLVTTTVCSGDGCSATTVGNVIIRDSEIDATAIPASEIAGSCAFLGVGTLQRNYMHGMGSGICFFETGTVHDALAEQNFVTALRSYGDSHNEAATVRDFRRNATDTRTVAFVNNRLDCSSGNVTAGLFIQPTWLAIYNLTVEGNYIEGDGYNLYVERGVADQPYGNFRAIDNRFRSTGWGPSAVTFGPGWTTWTENYLFDPAQPDGRGTVVDP